MLFDSPVFVVFLSLVVLLYWRLSWRAQNVFLLAASYFFYGWWDWRFLLLMAASTCIDYVVAKKLATLRNPRHRRALLILSLVVNFSFLGFFKYFNFFTGSLVTLLSSLGFHTVSTSFLRILLPPGISFYTFQEVAYIVDVYKGKLEPADSIVDYALFISLFPHLIAGPIQRPSHLLPQVQRERTMNWDKFFDGLMMVLFGFFQKCVIADNCAYIANSAFNGNFGATTLPVVLLGTYAFAWQIYGDFAGYSNIARGAAQLLGFHFMVNFRQPYLATTLQDFWRRWHISLSSWLRDYLYIPLGGNRKGEGKTYGNLLTTMLLGGLWHGANWTFVVWGGIHGAGLALERLLGLPGQEEVKSSTAVTWGKRIFLFNLVCLTWIFFRATSIHEALIFLGGLGRWEWRPEYLTACKFLVLFSVPMFLMDLRMEKYREEYIFQNASPWIRTGLGFSALVAVAFFAANQASTFIYFQF
jgi:D-alanyl-lipoteichoic acid acyltransferase DltB (MBOAT superfamily)